MAASAYAFLVSLMNTMDQIQIHPFISTCFHNFPFESLREKVDFLVDFVENYSDAIVPKEVDLLVDADSSDAEGLLNRIAVAAQKVEDIIEVEAADRIRDGSTEIRSSFLLDLQEEIEGIDRIINEEVIKVKEGMRLSEDDEHSPPTSSMAPPPSSAPSATAKTTMVGFDSYLNQLLEELNGSHSSRRILPIVGMGGVGKTTLARNVYESPLMVESFAIRVWVTISQTFSVCDIFQQALSCVGESSSGTTDDLELGEKLRKTLYGRRYLIVLDDMWSVEAWEKIKFYFPDTSNRSRIVVTTRQQELVHYFASSAVEVDLLNDKNSWKLFCAKTFAKKEGCPGELEAIGKKIVKKCKGLPLAIDLIGGVLGRWPRAQEYWERIAQDKTWILEYSGNSNTPLSMLYLSYKHLPVCFKPCFLYLGLFAEDRKINVSQLIKLWIAEGFIKAKANQTLEEVAESYVKELVDRNLILGGALRLNKKFQPCFLHDLVRELCIKIADKENFYYVQRDLSGQRHFIADQRSAKSYSTSESPSLYRPLLLEGKIAVPFKSRLLRVFVSPRKLSSQEVNLRLLADYNRNVFKRRVYTPKLPPSLSLFWSLQTVVFPETMFGVLLSDIWRMPQLRHVEISPLNPPNPTTGDSDAIVLRNLGTLKTVWNFNLSEEACRRIPNIKDLEIYCISEEEDCESWPFNLQNIGCLNKLESLFCSFNITVPLKNLKLPNSLMELSLCGCLLSWSYLAIIGLLPRLRILRLLERAVVGAAWNLGVEEKFLSLKLLRIQKCDDLIYWDAYSSNFPVLETLSIEHLSKLEEIPLGIGDIPTLEIMHVYECSESAAMSAIKILEEQESLENLDLRLQLRFRRSEAEIWEGKIQELGIACRNLHISSTD